MKTIIGVIEVLRALFTFYRTWREWRRKVDQENERKRAIELERAVDDSKKAETDEEILDTQRRITDNSY